MPRESHQPDFGGKYEVRRVLGRGGMGTVFEARHCRLGHRVAIKVLVAEFGGHPALVKRFEREALAAGALSSAHAVKIFDIDQTEDGRPFLVMELLAGCDLAYVVDHEGQQPVGDAVRWIIEACDAIGEAHRLGIVHRDVKPSNLLLCEDGRIKVVDFGIAKHTAMRDARLTVASEPLGTPQYMSPEQVRSAHAVDARSDIWSLGATLYELVCGRPPFNDEAPEACIASLVVDPVPDPRTFRPDLPDAFVDVLSKMLAKNVAERYQSIDELVVALQPFMNALPSPSRRLPRSAALARPTTPLFSQAPSRMRRLPMVLAGAAALAAALFVGLPRATHLEAMPLKNSLVANAEAAPTLAAAGAIGASPILATSPTLAVAELTPDPEPAREPEPAVEAAPAAKPKPARRAVVASPELGIHGGLSNPGF